MNIKKIWSLDKPDANQIDATFIFGLGCEVKVIVPEWQEFTSYPARDPYIEITTTCEKQESMLQLKYSNNLYLLKVEYEDFNMAPHSRSTT
jgi:hypothetical protein